GAGLGGRPRDLFIEHDPLDSDDQAFICLAARLPDEADPRRADKPTSECPMSLPLRQYFLEHAHSLQMDQCPCTHGVATKLVPGELLAFQQQDVASLPSKVIGARGTARTGADNTDMVAFRFFRFRHPRLQSAPMASNLRSYGIRTGRFYSLALQCNCCAGFCAKRSHPPGQKPALILTSNYRQRLRSG